MLLEMHLDILHTQHTFKLFRIKYPSALLMLYIYAFQPDIMKTQRIILSVLLVRTFDIYSTNHPSATNIPIPHTNYFFVVRLFYKLYNPLKETLDIITQSPYLAWAFQTYSLLNIGIGKGIKLFMQHTRKMMHLSVARVSRVS